MDNPVRSTNFETYSFYLQRFSFPVIPHSSVQSYRFHPHTDPSRPDPVRAHHVLTWCASRSAPRPTDSKNRLPPLSPVNATLLASLQKQIVKQLLMRPLIFLCIRKSRRRDHPLWRTRRMSETEQLRQLCWRTRNGTYLPTRN